LRDDSDNDILGELSPESQQDLLKDNDEDEDEGQLTTLVHEKGVSVLPPYKIKNHCLYLEGAKGKKGKKDKYLANYHFIVHGELKLDNGRDTEYKIKLQPVCEGKPLEAKCVSSREFKTPNFVVDNWGFKLSAATENLAPIRKCIERQAQKAKTEVTCTHTGWRKEGGIWVYNHANGAIGTTDDICVDLGNERLNRYSFPKDSRFDEEIVKEFIDEWFRLPPHVSYSLIGFSFLTPLMEFLRQADIAPGFIPYLVGTTGCGKSTIAALALSFFGKFDSRNLPASFRDTANSIGKVLFSIKDAPCCIDDYHPTGGNQEAGSMQKTAQAVVRDVGNGTGRGRMDRSLNLQKTFVPRGTCLMTGEDIPQIGESGLARLLFIEIQKDEVSLAVLNSLREKWESQNAFMMRYIESCIPQVEMLPERLHYLFTSFRDKIYAETTSEHHGRTIETAAYIETGCTMFFEFLEQCGIVDKAKLEEIKGGLPSALTALMEAQARYLRADKPTTVFIRVLREMCQAREAWIQKVWMKKDEIDEGDILESSIDVRNKKPLVGFRFSKKNKDGWPEEYFHLLPDAAYREVFQFCQKQGIRFPVSQNTLWKQMAQERLIIPGEKRITTHLHFYRSARDERDESWGIRMKTSILFKGDGVEKEDDAEDE
jgi:hypothetical protein